MRLNSKHLKIFPILVALFFGLGIFLATITSTVNAQNGGICIPSDCPDDYIPDTTCISRKLLDPKVDCCDNKCPGDQGAAGSGQIRRLTKIFGQDIYVYSDKILAGLVNMAITTVLGAISAYALIYGVYVGGFVRSKTTDSGEIEKANRTLVNLILGFILAWSLIFIVQIVFSVLGLGSINELVITGSEAEGLGIKENPKILED